jgi:hypothetical protein
MNLHNIVQMILPGSWRTWRPARGTMKRRGPRTVTPLLDRVGSILSFPRCRAIELTESAGDEVPRPLNGAGCRLEFFYAEHFVKLKEN